MPVLHHIGHHATRRIEIQRCLQQGGPAYHDRVRDKDRDQRQQDGRRHEHPGDPVDGRAVGDHPDHQHQDHDADRTKHFPPAGRSSEQRIQEQAHKLGGQQKRRGMAARQHPPAEQGQVADFHRANFILMMNEWTAVSDL